MSETNKEGLPEGVWSKDNQIDSKGMPAEREETKRVEKEMDRLM